MAQQYLIKNVADLKQADIQHLTKQVELAQNRVTQGQAIVDALQAKSNQFAGFLGQATDNKASAQANYKLARDMADSLDSLSANFARTEKKTEVACKDAEDVAKNIAQLISKLIFSVEVIGKVGQLINKQKAINPQLPDTLIGFMARAATNANSAVALTLTALQSCYAAESTLLESAGVMRLSSRQADGLKKVFEQGWQRHDASTPAAATTGASGVAALLQQVSEQAVHDYKRARWDNDSVGGQLAFAQTQLALAVMDLGSYQAGLRAATAAAYAA
jgi:hypothetical protein